MAYFWLPVGSLICLVLLPFYGVICLFCRYGCLVWLTQRSRVKNYVLVFKCLLKYLPEKNFLEPQHLSSPISLRVDRRMFLSRSFLLLVVSPGFPFRVYILVSYLGLNVSNLTAFPIHSFVFRSDHRCSNALLTVFFYWIPPGTLHLGIIFLAVAVFVNKLPTIGIYKNRQKQ